MKIKRIESYISVVADEETVRYLSSVSEFDENEHATLHITYSADDQIELKTEFKYNEKKKQVQFFFESGDDRREFFQMASYPEYYKPDNYDINLVQATIIKENNKVYMHGKDNLIISYNCASNGATSYRIEKVAFKKSVRVGVVHQWEWEWPKDS